MALKFVDQNSLIYIFTKIKENFVAKEAGKGLSTNDFTTDLKSKLEGVAAGAQVNVLEGVQVNGTDLTISGKKVNITVPTKIADLGKVTESDLDEALAEKVNAAAEGNHSHTNKTVLDGITSSKVSAWDAAEQNAKTYADGLNTSMDNRMKVVEAAVGEGGSVQDQIDASIEALDLANTYDAKGAAAAAETAAKTYADGLNTTLASRVTTNEQAIATLNGTGEGSVDKKVADAINEFSAAISDDGTVNTYKELIDYAAEHGSEFTELVGVVDGNTKAIESIEANYVKTADMVALTNSEIDEAFAQA